MQAATLEDEQARLPEILDKLVPGEGVVITRNDTPLARLVAEKSPKGKPRKAFSAKGMLVIVQDDEHLEDSEQYM